MRTIKFRAWDGKKMREWGFLHKGAFVGIPTESGAMDYPQMQFTGLLDKNGKEIYEGDILLNTSGWDISGNQVIRWNEKNAWFELGDEGEKLSKYAVHEFWEIIGNIYENPELLQ